MTSLNIPNNYVLDFFVHFDYTTSEALCPFYTIPCRYDKNNDKVIVDKDIFLMFRPDVYYLLGANFFSKTDNDHSIHVNNGISNYSILEEMMNINAYNTGLTDLIVGFYDRVEDEFVQIGYIENFYDKRTYGILDFAYNAMLEGFYKDEDMLDLRIEETATALKNIIHPDISVEHVMEVVEKLKRVCIEASFPHENYKNNIMEMNEDISITIQNMLREYEISSGVDIQTEMSFITYLKKIGVIEMYITLDERKFYSIDDARRQNDPNINESYNLVLGFHPSFLEMLGEKYS